MSPSLFQWLTSFSSGFLYLFLESYDAKVEGGWLLTKEISVEDELSTCMWLKLGQGNWKFQERDDFVNFAHPVWLEMQGMNMLTSLRGESDSLFLVYIHGGISEMLVS